MLVLVKIPMFLIDFFLLLIFYRKSGIKWSEFSDVAILSPKAQLLYYIQLNREVSFLHISAQGGAFYCDASYRVEW